MPRQATHPQGRTSQWYPKLVAMRKIGERGASLAGRLPTKTEILELGYPG